MRGYKLSDDPDIKYRLNDSNKQSNEHFLQDIQQRLN